MNREIQVEVPGSHYPWGVGGGWVGGVVGSMGGWESEGMGGWICK